jgi:predicted nucleic acid-binding protein
MKTLLDTNILTRMAQPGHPMQTTALNAVGILRQRGESLFLVPQNLYEFWVVATRPSSQNGLGFSLNQTQTEIQNLKSLFTLLEEIPSFFPVWEHLVTSYGVSGKQAHDTRLVAAMQVHGLDQILTFNFTDFQRFPIITVLDPNVLIASTP